MNETTDGHEPPTNRDTLWRRWVFMLALFVLALVAPPARAQQEGRFDIQPLRPSGAPQDLVMVRQSRPIAHLSVAAGSYLDFSLNPLSLVSTLTSQQSTSLIAFRLELDVMASVGLFDWAELGVVMPLVLLQLGDNLEVIGTEGAVMPTVTGDLQLNGKIAIPGLRRKPAGKGFGGALTLAMRFPTGSKDAFAGDGTVGGSVGLVVDHRWRNGILVTGNAGYLVRPTLALLNIKVGDLATYGLGLEVPVARRSGIFLFTETYGYLTPASLKQAYSTRCDLLLGVRGYASTGFTWSLGLGVAGCSCAPEPRLQLSLIYVLPGTRERQHIENFKNPPEDPEAPEGDFDHDHILNAADRCPKEPGPPENRGCPDRDADGDGIVDRLDKCPHDAAPNTADGCPTVRLAGNALVPREPLRCATGLDVISPDSNQVMDEFAGFLKAHPDLPPIAVEGHTQSAGGIAHDLQLSQRRADAVVAALVKRGIAASRLHAVGVGPKPPLPAPLSGECGIVFQTNAVNTPLLVEPPVLPAVALLREAPVEAETKGKEESLLEEEDTGEITVAMIEKNLATEERVREEETELVDAPRIFEHTPWNAGGKKEAFKNVQKTAGEVRVARKALAAAKTAKGKAGAKKALDKLEAKLEAQGKTLKKWVLSQMPQIERKDKGLKFAREALSEAQEALNELRGDHAPAVEIAKAENILALEAAKLASKRAKILADINDDHYGLTPMTRHTYTFIIDGEPIHLYDHVESYATCFLNGFDGGATAEGQGKGKRIVSEFIDASPLSNAKKVILKKISESEGSFSTMNTFDQAVLTAGFIQWTGGKNSDLTMALALIRRKYPEAFRRRFQRYGIDLDEKGRLLVVRGALGESQGDDAATAIQNSPMLTAVIARAGLDEEIRLGQLEAASAQKIDSERNHVVFAPGLVKPESGAAVARATKKGKPKKRAPPPKVAVRIGDVITSEYGVAALADHAVHMGSAKVAIQKQLVRFLAAHKYDPADVKAWRAEAETALLPTIIGSFPDRAKAFEIAGLSKKPGSFQ